jgi:hypothetical protein
MEPATGSRSPNAFLLFLAGLEAGMMGALCFLAWMGATAVLAHRSFWTSENLMASVFYGGDAIRGGLAASTFSGLALYLLLYSLLGAVFATAIRNRLPRLRLTLAGVLFGLCWYSLSFRLIWRSVAPLVTLLHIENTTIWGHAIYGALLARYPVYVARRQEPERAALPEGVVAGPPADPQIAEVAAGGPSEPETPE